MSSKNTIRFRRPRKLLPVEMKPRSEFNLWDILKNCVGKELTRITIPVIFNEPLSFLQRMGEYLEYSDLLFKAAHAHDPVKRLEYISAFAVSAVSSNWDRLGKPFNPLLGETFELDRRSDLGFHLVCEQVSHHPPTSAFHVESFDGSWTFHGAITPKLSFWGKSVDINPKGHVTLELSQFNETYTWHNPQCIIHNILVGKLWVEHCGEMKIINHSNGYKAELTWHESSIFSSDCHQVDGYIFNEHKQKMVALYGKWVDSMYSLSVEQWKLHKHSGGKKRHSVKLLSNGSAKSGDDGCGSPLRFSSDSDDVFSPSKGLDADLSLPGQVKLWQVLPRPEETEKYYCFSYFAMGMNDPTDKDVMLRVAPTDCRRRPDMRALENGDLELAQQEKLRLEDKQRHDGKHRRHSIWFRSWKNPFTKKEFDWKFTGEYWKRTWVNNCPDIF